MGPARLLITGTMALPEAASDRSWPRPPEGLWPARGGVARQNRRDQVTGQRSTTTFLSV